jgi:predicted phage-related endonuclease
MKTLKFETKEDWLNARRGRVTGSKLKDIVSKRNPNVLKLGFYELVADKISLPSSGESQMDIGIRLEEEAVARFTKETGKKVDASLVIWHRDDNESIAYSPDAFIPGKKITEAVEVKCLSAPRHIEAYITQEIPDEYIHQTRQAFVANEDLKTLHVVFYNPLIPSKDYFVIKVERKNIEAEIKEHLEYELQILEKVNGFVAELTF